LTLALVVAKALVGHWRGSPALTADAVHSLADAIAIFAAWLGLKLAERPATERFPFGLYRAETLATLIVAGVIFFAGLHLLIDSVGGLMRSEGPVHRSIEVLGVALLSAVLSSGIFIWERRVGSRLNSQSLLANADESRMDILTSLGVFFGAGATYLGVPRVELVVTACLSLLVLWLGIRHGRGAIYALLDARLDPELEQHAAEIAEAVPGVLKVEQVRLRRAGPFCFGVMHIHVRRSTDVTRAHQVAHQVVDVVRAEIPSVEMLTVHAEPFRPEAQRVVVPATGNSAEAEVSEHFGRARYFACASVSASGTESLEFIENEAWQAPARAGLAAIKELLSSYKADAVLTREIGEIAFHALRDHYVEVYRAPEGTVREALKQFGEDALPAVPRPTHASEAAGSPKDSTEARGDAVS